MTVIRHNSLPTAIPQARQLIVQRAGDDYFVVDGHGCFFAKTHFEPDAHRIAAVFDLQDALGDVLNMLKAAHMQLGMRSEDNWRVIKARAALAKAKGLAI